MSVVDVSDVRSRAFKVLDTSDDALLTEDIYRLIPGNWAPWNLPRLYPLSFLYKPCKESILKVVYIYICID